MPSIHVIPKRFGKQRSALPHRSTFSSAPTPAPIDIEAQESRSAASSPGPPSLGGSSVDLTLRKVKKSRTAQVYQPQARGRSWRPGQEPGIDPNHPSSAQLALQARCKITVVEFSQDNIHLEHLNNDTLDSFLNTPRNEEFTCRWINVNGISWDVISAIGKAKNFHRLAIEDMINRKNRTKADWYSDHTYSASWLLNTISYSY